MELMKIGHAPKWVCVLLFVSCSNGSVNDSGLVETDTDWDTDTDDIPLRDADADGFLNDVDCDDYNPATYPGAPEEWDLKDNDCDGRIDGNGAYEGTANVLLSVVYEGQLRQWRPPCSGTLVRQTTQVQINLQCSTTELDDPLATTILGEVVTVKQVDNVVSGPAWGGEILVSSTADWETDGSASLVWATFARSVGEVQASAANLQLTGDWTFTLSPGP